MIRVFDLDRSREFYENALELRVEDHFDFDGFSLTYMRNDETDFEIELTLNKDQSAPYTHGDGYGHVAVCVDDLAAERVRITGPGNRCRRDQGILPRRRADGAIFLFAGPGRLQNRGVGASRALPLIPPRQIITNSLVSQNGGVMTKVTIV